MRNINNEQYINYLIVYLIKLFVVLSWWGKIKILQLSSIVYVGN